MSPLRRPINVDTGIAVGRDFNVGDNAKVGVNNFHVDRPTFVFQEPDGSRVGPETLARLIKGLASGQDEEELAQQLDAQADLERGLERLALQVQRRDRILEAWPACVVGLPHELIPRAEEARSALADGRFVQAETIVTEHFVAARCGDRSCGDRALQARWLEVAAEICRADFRYRGAADRFAQADERLSDADRDRRPLLKWRAARALLDAAWEFGDIDAAERARESFEGLAGRAGRKLPAGDRLRVTLEFGEAYLRLARLRGEPSDLAEARDILAEVVNDAEEMDDTTPLVIDAKSYLGLALHWLGEWTADPDACRRAVEQFEAVLGAVTSLSPDAIDEDTRRRVRSMLHHQVGLTLTRLGERESGDAGLVRLDEALTALDRAIADRGAEHDGGSLRDRRGWAESSNARLVTLLSKAERTGDTGLLWQAYAEAERVLKHRPRERVPLQWAATEANRANALAALARQTGERDRWRDAVAAYSAALECFDRDKTPFDWATTSGNLGIALLHTADSEDDLVEAERVLAEASSALSTERAPIQYGIILNTLGGCRAMLADARGDRAAMEAARATFEEAAATFTSAGAEAYLGQAEANIERANESLAAMA